MSPQVISEAKAVKERPAAEHVLESMAADEVGKRIGRIVSMSTTASGAASTDSAGSPDRPAFLSRSLSRPARSRRSVAPPVFSLTPAAII